MRRENVSAVLRHCCSLHCQNKSPISNTSAKEKNLSADIWHFLNICIILALTIYRSTTNESTHFYCTEFLFWISPNSLNQHLTHFMICKLSVLSEERWCNLSWLLFNVRSCTHATQRRLVASCSFPRRSFEYRSVIWCSCAVLNKQSKPQKDNTIVQVAGATPIRFCMRKRIICMWNKDFAFRWNC